MARLYQPNFTGGILSEGMYARSDVEKYQTGVKDAVNFFIRAKGGLANRPGFRTVSGFHVPDARLVPFSFNSQDTYVLEFYDTAFHVIYQGSYVIDTSVAAQSVVDVTTSATAQIEMASAGAAAQFSAGDLVYLEDPAGTHAVDQLVMRVVGVSSEFITVDAVKAGAGLDTSGGASLWGAIGAGATLEKVFVGASPYAAEDLPALRHAQDADTLYLVHPSYAPRNMVRAAADDWTIAVEAFTPEIATPTGVSAAATVGSGTTSYSYKVSAISADTLEESTGSSTASTTNDLSVGNNYNTVSWSSVSGAGLYKVYRLDNGIYGYIGTTAGTSFKDQNFDPDTGDTPITVRNPFNAANKYPSVVSFVEQRLALAATNSDPQVVEMSRTDTFTNLGRNYPLQADDAIRFRVRARQVNRVRALVPSKELLMFTSSAEWVITGNEIEGILTPTSIVAKPHSYYGCANIEPLVVGEAVLFNTHSGETIRDFLLDRQPVSKDLTILASDLFKDRTLVSWTYTQSPDELVWVALDDGTLLSMTYIEEHEVWGWTRHALGGDAKVRNVTSVREGVRDVLYAVVERDFGGGTITVTEQLAKREDTDVRDSFFVDSGLSYDGDPATSVSGLLHLVGETVVALLDGNVLEDLVVDAAGKVTFPVAASKIHIGLPYTSSMMTLGVDFETQELGSMQGRFKAASEVAVVVEKSRGVSVGLSLATLQPLAEWTPDLADDPIPLKTETLLYSVDGDWLRDATITVAQTYPLPAIINGIAPEWAIGE